MADACADLIDQLSLEPAVRALVDTRIHGAAVPASAVLPLIWLQRRGVVETGALEAEELPLKELFDLECVAADASVAAELAAVVRAALNGYAGQMGDGFYSWVSVTSAGDEYVPRNLPADEHLFISALDVEVSRP
jgi:hypothetical protein